MPEHAHPPSSQPQAPNVWVRGGLATLVATIANLAVLYAAEAVLTVPESFFPFSPVRVIFLTLVGGALATAAYWLVERRAEDPPGTFVKVAAGALVLSWLPDIGLWMSGEPVAGVLALMFMHVVAAVILVAGLLWGQKR